MARWARRAGLVQLEKPRKHRIDPKAQQVVIVADLVIVEAQASSVAEQRNQNTDDRNDNQIFFETFLLVNHTSAESYLPIHIAQRLRSFHSEFHMVAGNNHI